MFIPKKRLLSALCMGALLSALLVVGLWLWIEVRGG